MVRSIFSSDFFLKLNIIDEIPIHQNKLLPITPCGPPARGTNWCPIFSPPQGGDTEGVLFNFNNLLSDNHFPNLQPAETNTIW